MLEEPYINGNETKGFIDGLTIPDNEVFVMGDNRGVSTDSRNTIVGTVPISIIVGKAVFRLYPFDRIGLF